MGQKLLCPSCKKTVIEWNPNPYDDGLICQDCYWRQHFERLREEKEHPIGSFLAPIFEFWGILILIVLMLHWILAG